MIRCESCGANAPENAPSCPDCGSRLGEPLGDVTMPLTRELGGAAASAVRVRTSTSASRLSDTSSSPDEGRFLPGTLVAGRYRMLGLIGRGGMGEVYRATDLTLAQSVALKILPEDAAANERLLERFHNEVRIARQVSHPNVCRVYDIGEADGLPFISMEYVDGEDLDSLLKRIGRLPSDKALEITRKICAGLAAAHERGIIHRDLKPHNVMLNRRGEIVIMDFGLAAVADELQGSEARSGTPAYQSPEQLKGASVTARSDIYALGLIAYELFTGKRAFDAKSVAELIRMQESGRPPSITSVAADVDPAVENAIFRCLQPDPGQRPATPLAVAAALPGGDPLAAALAAGETPSPEMVAASGKREGFALRYAVPMLALVLIALAAYPILMRPFSTLALAPLALEPSVLEVKARETAAALGYSAPPLDWKSWLERDEEYIAYLQAHWTGEKDWKKLFETESPIHLVYRESPRYLLSPPDGDITATRPAVDIPGMVLMTLDSRGQLREFSAIAQRTESQDRGPALDPAVAFGRAGLDIGKFTEKEPGYVPPLAFDSRRAWSGELPGLPGIPITVELASWQGKLTSFYIRSPWMKPVMGPEEPMKERDLLVATITVLTISTGLFCVVFFARLNLKKGRGDRAGGLRVAIAGSSLLVLAWLTSVHIVPRFSLLAYGFEYLSVAVAVGFLLWLMYQALEPAVRARWPHALITWNRVLAGNVKDPRVGSHILLGVIIGISICYLFLWRRYWVMTQGGAPQDIALGLLMGVRPLMHEYFTLAFGALQAGTAIFFLLCGIRALLRKDWAAAIAASLLLSLQQGSIKESMNLRLDITLFFLVYAVLAFLLLRIGLVAAVVGIFVANTAMRIPVGSSFSSWLNPIAATSMIIVAALAVFGFWRSQTHTEIEPTALPGRPRSVV